MPASLPSLILPRLQLSASPRSLFSSSFFRPTTHLRRTKKSRARGERLNFPLTRLVTRKVVRPPYFHISFEANWTTRVAKRNMQSFFFSPFGGEKRTESLVFSLINRRLTFSIVSNDSSSAFRFWHVLVSRNIASDVCAILQFYSFTVLNFTVLQF